MSLRVRERYEATCGGYDELYRAEQMEKYAAALKRVKPRGVVLDAGCGTGLLAEYMKATGLMDYVDAYICLDYSSCMLGIAKWRLGHLCPSRCVVVEGNVESIPLRDKSVDVTYSFTVLDLVEDLDAAVRELKRVTRGPVVASFMKRLPRKDRLMPRARLLAVTRVDVILEV
ncbi:class I SAM-dependent methyltransferase [Stetteria hydrogenophila]